MASIIKRPDRPLPYFVYWREPVTKAQRSKAFKRMKDAEDFRDTGARNSDKGPTRIAGRCPSRRSRPIGSRARGPP